MLVSKTLISYQAAWWVQREISEFYLASRNQILKKVFELTLRIKVLKDAYYTGWLNAYYAGWLNA
jgi:hypothetical protein